jgi:hypothetical protein
MNLVLLRINKLKSIFNQGRASLGFFGPRKPLAMLVVPDSFQRGIKKTSQNDKIEVVSPPHHHIIQEVPHERG